MTSRKTSRGAGRAAPSAAKRAPSRGVDPAGPTSPDPSAGRAPPDPRTPASPAGSGLPSADPAPSIDPALRTPDQLRAVARLLAEAADAYNQRLKAEAPSLSSGEVFARLQEEQRLRGVANQLYFEATDRTLADAVDAQDALEATLRDAHAALLRFARFERALELVADLLVLAGAIVARKGSTVLAALKEVRADLKAPEPADD